MAAARVDPYEAVIAVARAVQGNARFGRRMFDTYTTTIDPAVIAWAACHLLAQADRAVARAAGGREGDWLAAKGRAVAEIVVERQPDG